MISRKVRWMIYFKLDLNYDHWPMTMAIIIWPWPCSGAPWPLLFPGRWPTERSKAGEGVATVRSLHCFRKNVKHKSYPVKSGDIHAELRLIFDMAFSCIHCRENIILLSINPLFSLCFFLFCLLFLSSIYLSIFKLSLSLSLSHLLSLFT